MNAGLSLYLDLVRFLAALLVVIYHSNNRLIVQDILPLSNHGHAAVMVFFVLSGYVIAHVSAQRENTPVEYWSSRLSRFYILTVPVVLLCPLLDMAGQALAPALYAGATTHDLAGLRIASSLLYLNEVWNVSIMSFSNVPYWSLNYEMWYYILFGIANFLRGPVRGWLLLGCALLLGPKILLLAPVWALGVLLQRWTPLQRIGPGPGALLFAGSALGVLLFQHYQLTEAGSELLRRLIGARWHHELAFSKFALGDYPLALLIACNFAGARAIAPWLGRLLLPFAGPIRWLASYTFSLYLMHQPLLLFYGALIAGDPRGHRYYAEVMAATLATVWMAGSVTEHRREWLRQHLRRRLHSLAAQHWWQRLWTPATAQAGR